SIIEKVVAKQEVTAALLRGELTLAGAAERFEAANGAHPVAIARLRALYPGAGDEELAYRQVLHFAHSDRRMPAAVVAARLPRLAAEFRAPFPAAHPLADWAQAGITVR